MAGIEIKRGCSSLLSSLLLTHQSFTLHLHLFRYHTRFSNCSIITSGFHQLETSHPIILQTSLLLLKMYASNAIILAIAGVAAAQTSIQHPHPTPMPTGGHNGTVTTTVVYDVYTTYCPYPTTVDFNGKKYVVDKPTTLTITDCPCTVVEERPVGTRGPGDVWPGQKPDGGDNKPDGGDNKPNGGDNKPDGGDNKPDGGDNKPDGGDNKPDGGDNKPDGGDNNPDAPEESVIITNGASAMQLSFGVAAALGLLAL